MSVELGPFVTILLDLQQQTSEPRLNSVGQGRFCCKSNLEAIAESDSVTVTRTFARYCDDGSAQPRSGAVVLLLQS
jgi:hypothetical protein